MTEQPKQTQKTVDRLEALNRAIAEKRALIRKGEAQPRTVKAKPPRAPTNASVSAAGGGAEPDQMVRKLQYDREKAAIPKGRTNKLPSGLTVKQEAFALHVARGHSLTDSYRHAYDCETMSTPAIHTQASRIGNEPAISQRITEIRRDLEEAKQRVALRDRDRWMRRAWFEAEGTVIDPETGQPESIVVTPASRVAALSQLGKALRITENQPDEQERRDASTIAQEIAQLLQSFGDHGALPEGETPAEPDELPDTIPD